MRYTPQTKEQIAEGNLIPAGTYDYEVFGATEKVSSKGNDMMELTLHVFVGEKTRTITDYLLDAMPEKFYAFCETNGLLKEYNAMTFCPDDAIKGGGKVEIGDSKPKPGYAKKSEVKMYLPANTKNVHGVAATDDDLPDF